MWTELTPLQLKLAEKGIIELSGEVDGDMAYYVRAALTVLKAEGSPDISVHITSDGGLTQAGLDIYDMLRLYPGKTEANVIAFARSSAAIILQGCTLRRCSRHAHVLIHHPRFSETLTLDDLKNQKKIEKFILLGEDGNRAMYKIFAERTKMTRPQIRKLCLEDRDINAQEALKLGLVDEIV